MTVAEVWGHIQGYDASLITHEGDKWIFRVPSWVTGSIIAEFWAKDDVGNISYRAGVFSIAEGTIKCIRWLTSDGICTMKSIDRTNMATMDHARASCIVEVHTCAKMEG